MTTVNRKSEEDSAGWPFAHLNHSQPRGFVDVPRPETVEYFGACWNPLKNGEVTGGAGPGPTMLAKQPRLLRFIL